MPYTAAEVKAMIRDAEWFIAWYLSLKKGHGWGGVVVQVLLFAIAAKAYEFLLAGVIIKEYETEKAQE